MRAKSLTEHLESPSSKTAAAAAALSRGVPIIRRASSCSSDDSLTLENKGSESKPCAGDVAFNRALAALASQRRQSERQGHRRTRIDNRSDNVGVRLSGERKSDPIAEDEDSHSAIHLISIVHSVDSGESSLHRLENESIKFECGETPGKKAADDNFCGDCTSTFAADIEGTNRVVEEFDPQGNNASLSVNDLGISIVDVVLKKSHENASAISEDLLEEDYSEHSSSPEYSSDDESAVEDLRDEGRDVVGSTVALSTFECDAQSNPSRSSKVCMTSYQFFNMRLRRKLPNRSFSLLLISIVLVMACSIAVLVVVIVSGPHNDHQSTLRGSAVNQPQSTSTLTDKKHQPTQQPVGVQINSKSPTTRPSDFGPIPPASLQNMFDSIKSTSAAPTPSPVLDEVTPNFYLSSNMATPDPDTLYPMVEETNGELAQFEQVANVLTRVPNPIESITGCADTGTERYLFDNIITEFMCPPPAETRSLDPTFVFKIGPSFVDGIRVFAATQCDRCDPISYRLEGSNDEGKTFYLISQGPFDSDWINQEMPPRRNSKFASTLGGLDRLSFGYANFTTFDGFVPMQYSHYRIAFTQMRGFKQLMWLGELQIFGSLEIP